MKRSILLAFGTLVLISAILLAGTFPALSFPLPGFDDLSDMTPPNAPGDLNAVAISNSAINLTWTDNSDNEVNFYVQRKQEGETEFTTAATINADVTSYQDSGLIANTKYYYLIIAAGKYNFSYSNEASATTKSTIIIPVKPVKPVIPVDPDIILPLLKPAAPSNLEADAISNSEIDLSWTDNANNEKGFNLERSMTQVNGYNQIAKLPADTTSYKDADLDESITYFYRIKAYNSNGDSAYSPLASAKTSKAPTVAEPKPPVLPPAAADKTILKFYINSDKYFVNGVTNFMDTAPINKDSRTLLPIRYVATPLGADVGWDPATQKVSITLGNNVIHLWINKGTALVNGVQKPIDENNSSVSPIIVPPGRTMLPLRFIAENLGCQVEWEQVSNEAKVTYPK